MYKEQEYIGNYLIISKYCGYWNIRNTENIQQNIQ